MDAFSVLAEMAGDVELTPDQLAQIRALDARYYTALFRLQHAGEPGPAGAVGAAIGEHDRARDELAAGLRADVRAVLDRRAPGDA